LNRPKDAQEEMMRHLLNIRDTMDSPDPPVSRGNRPSLESLLNTIINQSSSVDESFYRQHEDISLIISYIQNSHFPNDKIQTQITNFTKYIISSIENEDKTPFAQFIDHLQAPIQSPQLIQENYVLPISKIIELAILYISIQDDPGPDFLKEIDQFKKILVHYSMNFPLEISQPGPVIGDLLPTLRQYHADKKKPQKASNILDFDDFDEEDEIHGRKQSLTKVQLSLPIYFIS